MATEIEAARTQTADANAAMISQQEMDRFEEEARSVFLDFNATATDRFEFMQQTMAAQNGELTPAQMLYLEDLQTQFGQLMNFLTSLMEDMKQMAMNVIHNIGR